MKRCIELAKKGLGSTYPNPMVGCVIVYENKIIGEGWHQQAGKHHAEVIAINNVIDPRSLKNASLYVSLEPCSHYGKTPPCANLIIDMGIKNIIIGSHDPNPLVAGKGIKLLREAGCHVEQGALKEQCDLLNRRFFTYHIRKRPYIILKWAETADGFIAPMKMNREKTGPIWISNEQSQQLVHRWRSEEQAILVGTKTVLDDNPSLTTRKWKGNSPVRIIIDRHLKIPEDFSVFDHNAKTIVITEKDKESTLNLIYEKVDFSNNMIHVICDLLYKHQIQSMIVEGGANTLDHFINSNMWDEARVFIGNTEFNEGIKSPRIQKEPISQEKINSDTLMIYKND